MDAFEVVVDGDDLVAAARGELKGNGAGAGKEIEDGKAFEVEIVEKNVEQTFFGEVGCGSDDKIVGGYDVSPPVWAADYTHNGMLIRVK